MPSAVLVVNTSSGYHLDHPDALTDLLRYLGGRGITPHILEGPVDDQIAESVRMQPDVVIVDGGDGTISSTISAHAGTGRPVGLVPGGTMNLLAADYGIPSDRAEAAALIAHGKARAFDAGALDGRLFLHTALTGLPVRIGAHREKRRGDFGPLDKARVGLHALATVGSDETLELTIEDPPGSAPEECATFAFLVGTLTSGHLLPRPERRADGNGVITALSAHVDSGIDVARIVLRGALGDVREDPDVSLTTFSRATLSCSRRSNVHAMLDGERALIALPAEISVRRHAVNVIAPEATTHSETETGKSL